MSCVLSLSISLQGKGTLTETPAARTHKKLTGKQSQNTLNPETPPKKKKLTVFSRVFHDASANSRRSKSRVWAALNQPWFLGSRHEAHHKKVYV